MSKQLLVLGCSQAKRTCAGFLPAIDRYDGSPYRVLRNFLRDYQWPSNVSIGVLSAKHGLFGVLKGIEYYDTRMDRFAATAKAEECSTTLKEWASDHNDIHLSLGRDYLPAVQPALDVLGSKAKVYSGPIGMKLHQIKAFLDSTTRTPRSTPAVKPGTGKLRYFLPDWDDLLDPDFNFKRDAFSGATRGERSDKHCCVLIRPKRMCDGVLVSLAQHGTSKGPLRRLEGREPGALSPLPLRSHFGLKPDQWLFGDCGAFSYVNEDEPTISVEQAVALYDVYGFDFGASVDHIPVGEISKNGKQKILSLRERQSRVRLTRLNAELFIQAARERKVRFNPVGTIQALSPVAYAESVQHYYELGYRHMAIGGLVPQSDNEIASIVRAVSAIADKLKERPWIHLFGIFRPKLQGTFRSLKVDSFDSATYFRKAWLRSDQNYLGTNGKWYAALRVPMTSDGRTRKRLEEANVDIDQLEREECEALRLLCLYDKGKANINEVLDAVLHYDRHLTRSDESKSMRTAYRRTLLDRPWEKCDCPFCQDIGIHTLIFRGANRNKRRGAHNTMMLYGSLEGDMEANGDNACR